MTRRFHRDFRVRAAEPLLYERVPLAPPLYQVPVGERAPSRVMPAALAPSVSRFDTPHSGTPKTQVFGNGRFALMVTNAGGGYSRYKGFEITRWRSDTTRDRWGSFCYIRDAKSGETWSNTHHPVGREADEFTVNFAVDRAEFRRSRRRNRHRQRDHRLARGGRRDPPPHADQPLAEAPGTGVDQLHRTFAGAPRCRPSAPRLLQALRGDRGRSRTARPAGPPAAAGAGRGADLGRAPDGPGRSPSPEPFRFETDRGRFIGRGRSAANPAALEGELSNSSGHVLDPVFSLRTGVKLDPGQSVQVSLILAAADSREEILALLDRFSGPPAVEPLPGAGLDPCPARAAPPAHPGR